jgi:hypothetical protein
MKGLLQGRSYYWDSKGVPVEKVGGKFMKVAIRNGNWKNETGIEVECNWSYATGHTYSIYITGDQKYRYDDNNPKIFRHLIHKFSLEYVEKDCPLCRTGEVSYDKENDRYECSSCDLSYTKDSMNLLSQVDDKCKAIIEGCGIIIKKL